MCDVIKFRQGISGEGADPAYGLRVMLCGQLRPSMMEYGDNVRQYFSDGDLGELQWGTINFCQA